MFIRKRRYKIMVLFLVFALCFSLVLAIVKVIAYNEGNSLLGKVIFIDPGHGGKDNGASVDNVLEDNINMNISGYLFELLIEEGAFVLISRAGDYDLASLYQKNRKKDDLNRRVKYIRDSNPDIFISLHLNTYPSEEVKGAQVFFQGNDDSRFLANILQEKLNVLTSYSRNSKFGDYFILNNTKNVGVLIECGFLTNTEERRKLNDEVYQLKIANSIKKGIVEYFANS